jgi:hypothetical protein
MIFNRESVVFNPIRINSAHGFQPATVIAEKWRIRHMIVICAPTSGGKSTIAERLCKDPDFRQRFGLEDVQWTIMKAEDFFLRPREIQQNVIVMYNLLRRRNKKIDPQSEDPLLEIFCAAEHLTIITLLPTPERLRVQFERGEVSDPTRRYSPKILSLLKSYQDDTFLADWYRAWFEYSESLAPGHSTKWLVKFTSDEGHISDTSGWRKIVAEFYCKLVDSAP